MQSSDVVSADWDECYDVRLVLKPFALFKLILSLRRYYIVYVFMGSGLSGTRVSLIAAVGHVSCIVQKDADLLVPRPSIMLSMSLQRFLLSST